MPLLLLLLLLSICNSQNCKTQDPLIGCLTCDPATNYNNLAIDTITQKLICSNITNCIYSSNTSCYIYIPGCKSVSATAANNCSQCHTNFILTTNTTTNLTYCKYIGLYPYCQTANATGCATCVLDAMLPNSTTCVVPVNLCSSFNYSTWKCNTCIYYQVMHSSGQYCVSPIDNCLQYNTSGCATCSQGYYLMPGLTCVDGSSTNLYLQISPGLPLWINTSVITICLSLSSIPVYTSGTITCTALNTTIPHCITVVGGYCLQCMVGYYSSESGLTCNRCAFDYCLACTAGGCIQCLPGYFLEVSNSVYISGQLSNPTSNSGSSVCLSCGVYSCTLCQTRANSNKVLSVVCLECLPGFTLAKGNCISCRLYEYYNVTVGQCVNCSISNCINCNATRCLWCADGYIVSSALTTCVTINTSITTTISQAFELLSKYMPGQNTTILNDQKQLITSCPYTSNGYACLCPSLVNISLLCSNTTYLLSNLNISSWFPSVNLTKPIFIQNIPVLRMLSTLGITTNTYQYHPALTDLLSKEQFASYVQIQVGKLQSTGWNIINMTTRLNSVVNWVFTSMYLAFPEDSPTILSGPSYYFKYLPANSTDDTGFISVSPTAYASICIVIFDQNASIPNITGKFMVYINSTTASPPVNVTIKKTGILSYSYAQQLYKNNQPITPTGSLLNTASGYIQIPSVSVSNSSLLYQYQVGVIAATTASNTFSSQRIENIFYKDGFIYVAIFLALYLILLPMCAVCDFVDNKAPLRKIHQGEDKESMSYQGIAQQKSMRQGDETTVIKVNYRDFFPIYNIANTPRPKRFLKLCLFLVNMQHSITFLTLIYFHLPDDYTVAAVVLGLPAYLCTIIMGYVCGALVRHLPKWSKYLINLFSLGYWVLWVALMSSFTATVDVFNYKSYIYIFTIIFLLIDLLIDLLQTFLVYFTIMQQQKQIKLFKALARWLSYRGFYQFDQLASQLRQARQNP